MNKQLLKSLIVRYDGKQEALAEAMAISHSRLNAKINSWNGAQFTQREMDFIAQRYNLSKTDISKVFFK